MTLCRVSENVMRTSQKLHICRLGSSRGPDQSRAWYADTAVLQTNRTNTKLYGFKLVTSLLSI